MKNDALQTTDTNIDQPIRTKPFRTWIGGNNSKESSQKSPHFTFRDPLCFLHCKSSFCPLKNILLNDNPNTYTHIWNYTINSPQKYLQQGLSSLPLVVAAQVRKYILVFLNIFMLKNQQIHSYMYVRRIFMFSQARENKSSNIKLSLRTWKLINVAKKLLTLLLKN